MIRDFELRGSLRRARLECRSKLSQTIGDGQRPRCMRKRSLQFRFAVEGNPISSHSWGCAKLGLVTGGL